MELWACGSGHRHTECTCREPEIEVQPYLLFPNMFMLAAGYSGCCIVLYLLRHCFNYQYALDSVSCKMDVSLQLKVVTP
jgi:hypothetical protein